jgi:hypothetical protein
VPAFFGLTAEDRQEGAGRGLVHDQLEYPHP